jgi:nucleoside-diphosphate-sugar epimerase
MARILVTGGCGFLGARFASRARAAGHAVTTADMLQGADQTLDVGDARAVEAMVDALRPEAIVHLAAGLTDAGERDPVGTVRTNALGTAAIFAAAEKFRCERVVYASSISAVGPTIGSIGDDARLMPGSVYGATKAFCEHLAHAMSAAGSPQGARPPGGERRAAPIGGDHTSAAGSPQGARPPGGERRAAPIGENHTGARSGTARAAPRYLGLRFGYVYGPGRVRGWREVQALIERVADGERELAYPDFAEAIDWTWIDDAATVLLRAIERALPPRAVLNVVGDKRRVRDAIAYLQRRFPDLRATPQAARTPPAAWGLVNDGLEALLGFVPATTLEQGIDAMLEARAGESSRPSR